MLALAKCQSFYFKVLYVIGKALTGKLSCKQIGHVDTYSAINIVISDFIIITISVNVSQYLRCVDTPSCFSTFFFTKGNNFIDFLFASVEEEVLPKEFYCLRKEFGSKEANSSLQELASFEKGMVRWSKVLGKF